MASPLENKVLKLNKCTDDESWKKEITARAEDFNALDAEGESKKDEMQLFLTEVLWSVMRGKMPSQKAAMLLAKTSVMSKTPLQQLLLDVMWMASFDTGTKEARDELNCLVSHLVDQKVVPLRMVALNLEIENLPNSQTQNNLLKKKSNQAKTKVRYTVQRYNLMKEHSEGYARMVVLLDRLADLKFDPEATPEQRAETEQVMADDIIRLTGFANLCPNRTLALAFDIYEKSLASKEDSALLHPMIELFKRFPLKRLTDIAIFVLLPPFTAAGKEPLPAPVRSSQMLMVASLAQVGMINLETLWGYLSAPDAEIKKVGDELMGSYNDLLNSIGKVDLTGGAEDTSSNKFDNALKNLNVYEDQKILLAAALVSVNYWSAADRLLKHLTKLCRPALNRSCREALTDLLKWLAKPYLSACGATTATVEGKPLESTFTGVRHFLNGEAAKGCLGEELKANAPRGNMPDSLKLTEDYDELLVQIGLVLSHLQHFLHIDSHVLLLLWRVVYHRQKARKEAGHSRDLEPTTLHLVCHYLLPASSLVTRDTALAEVIWNVLVRVSTIQRFTIYTKWEDAYQNFMLKATYARVKHNTKQVLKRVVAASDRHGRSDAGSNAPTAIADLCLHNPMPVLEVMLKDLEIGFNVNMIQPYVDATAKCSDMTADICSYLLSRVAMKPSSPGHVFLNSSDALCAPWLSSLGEFAGRFYKKHYYTDLLGLLTVVINRMGGATDMKLAAASDMPQEYKGESLIRIVFESILEHMGGVLTVSDYTAEQLVCLAGGPRLRSESLSIGGKKEDPSRKEKVRQHLLDTIIAENFVPKIWQSLGSQRAFYLSEDFAEKTIGGGLKLLCMLVDGNHQCFLQLIEFLSQSCSREKYASLMPPTMQVFARFDPPLAFSAIRYGLPSYGKAFAKMKEDGASNIEEPKAIQDIERCVRLYLPPDFENEGLSINFYVTFWRLSLQDIITPVDAYDRATTSIQEQLRLYRMQRSVVEKDHRNPNRERELRYINKEIDRQEDLVAKLREERAQQQINHKQVRERLEMEKSKWILKPSPKATSVLVADLLSPRLLNSYADAVFCCHFIKLLVELKTPGFHLLDFYNSWTIMLTQQLKSCSEREAQIFGVFLKDMMMYLISLRENEDKFKDELSGNPCFHRDYYEKEAGTQIEWTTMEDIKRGHAKWEGRIYKLVRAGVDSDEWMEKRNALLLLSQSYEAYPKVAKYAGPILHAVESMRDKEAYADLKTLANSIVIKLKSVKDHWLDQDKSKAAVAAVAAVEKKASPPPPREPTGKDNEEPSATAGSTSTRRPPVGDRDRNDGQEKRARRADDEPARDRLDDRKRHRPDRPDRVERPGTLSSSARLAMNSALPGSERPMSNSTRMAMNSALPGGPSSRSSRPGSTLGGSVGGGMVSSRPSDRSRR